MDADKVIKDIELTMRLAEQVKADLDKGLNAKARDELVAIIRLDLDALKKTGGLGDFHNLITRFMWVLQAAKKSLKDIENLNNLREGILLINQIEEVEKQVLGQAKSIHESPLYHLSTFTQFYWHAGITGSRGEIVESIIKIGVKPRSALSGNPGNENTGNELASYASNVGANALRYLKEAEGFNWGPGGLPFVLALKVCSLTKEYSFDTDISVGFDDLGVNIYCWYAFILTFDRVREFIDYKVYTSSQRDLQTLMSHLGPDSRIEHKKKDIWVMLHSKSFHFFEKQKLQKALETMDPRRWDRFLRILNSFNNHFASNVIKVGGWDPSYIKRIYIISPDGDRNWLHWAALMPRTKDYMTSWESWGNMSYDGTHYFPGSGKIVRIK